MAGTAVDPLTRGGPDAEGLTNSGSANGIATSTLMKGLLGVGDESVELEDRPRSRRSPSPGARGERGVRHKTSRDRLAAAVVDERLPHPQHPNRSPTRGTIGFDSADAPPLPRAQQVAASDGVPPVPASPQTSSQSQLPEAQQQPQLAYPAALTTSATQPLKINTPKTQPLQNNAIDKPAFSSESAKDAQRPENTRNRSSSNRFSLIGRKRSSSGTNDLSLTKSRESVSKSERSISPTSPKADLAALSKPKSKFKSGAKWDSIDVTGANVEQEPYLDTQDSPTQERKEMSLPSDAPSSPLSSKNPEELRAMATSGSTAALRALASSGQNIGAPVFAAQQRAAQEAAAKKAAAEKEANEKAFAAMGFQPVRTPVMPASAPHSRQSSNNSIQGRSTQGAPSLSNRSVNEAAQRVLQEARNAARGASNGLPPAAAAIPPPATVTANGAKTSPPLLPGSSLKQSTTADDESGSEMSRSKTGISEAETTTDSVKNSRRRSLLSMPSFTREKSSAKMEKRKTKSRGPSRANTPPDEEERRPSLGHSKSSTDDGTPRRRRFADTRELDLLATELAAQSLADHHLSMGVSHMPVSSQFMTAPLASSGSCRGSEAGPGGSNSPLSNTSQVSLNNGGASGASSSNGHGLGGGLGPLSQIRPAEGVRASPTFTPAFDARSLPVSDTSFLAIVRS